MKRQELLFDAPNGALFSDDRRYRYKLWRRWESDNARSLLCIGLNPSTADESNEDPTIRRVIRFAHSWGLGAMRMMNLFGYVTPYPKELVADDSWEMNREIIHINGKDVLASGGIVLFAWGNFTEARDRGAEVADLFPQAMCLGHNTNGSPKHPLYIRGDTVPTQYR